MNFRKAFILVPFVALFLIYSGCQASSAASVLFEKAKFTMETKGDLEGAIRLFNEIIEKHQEEREYAAKSQLYIGLCYEKQGKEKAREAYQRVIQKYADQQEVAAEARTRLDALEQAVSLARPLGMIVRKVQTDSTGWGNAISPDGRYIAYKYGSGDLAVYDQDSGKKRYLTDTASLKESEEQYAVDLKWSPDSKQIVYSWYSKQDSGDLHGDLRVIALDGSKPRILYSNAEKVVHIQPFAWSPDGRKILALFRKDSTLQIVTVSCADGSIGVLKEPGSLGDPVNSHISLSPDGRYIIFDSKPKDSILNHDIFLLAVDGSSEIPLVEHPAHDFVLGWAPDGKRILFASDRSGTWDAFLIKITDDGKPQGAPDLVKTNIGPVEPLGFTRKGSFYYFYNEGYSDIYTAELDPQTGKILGPAKKAIERYEGYNTYGDYSPDGKYLAYISKRGLACLSPLYARGGNVFCVHSLETGKDREIFPEGLERFAMPFWSPDSRFIFVYNGKPDNRKGIYRIDAQTSEVTLVVLIDQGVLPWPKCSLDGKAIYLTHYDGTKDLSQIVVRNLESGIEKEIYRAPSGEIIWEPSRSPDGQWLTFSTNKWSTSSTDSINKTSQKFISSLRIIPVTGGEARELYRGSNNIISQTWTADGRYILFCSQEEGEKDAGSLGWGLRRVSIAGGEPQKLGFDGVLWHLSAHPDGRRIAFNSYNLSVNKSSGIWAMENFLP